MNDVYNAQFLGDSYQLCLALSAKVNWTGNNHGTKVASYLQSQANNNRPERKARKYSF